MARQHIDLGEIAEDGNGDGLRDGGDKINDNFIENYAAIALNTAKVSSPWTAVTGGIRYSGGTVGVGVDPDEAIHALGNIKSDSGSYAAILHPEILEFTRGTTNYFRATTIGGRFVWWVNGSSDAAMTLNANNDLDVLGHISNNTAIINLVANTTLNATHKNKIIECNGTFTVTLPDSMPTGYKVDIVNIGIGVITFAASTTLQSEGSFTKLATQYTGASAYHRGSNVWIVVGKLTA